MISEENRFIALVVKFKAKGLSDQEALLEASDQLLFEQFKWQSAKDAEFEVIPPLMISDNKNTENEK